MKKNLLPLLFSATLLLSALLLFWVQPLVAKLLLPVLGGTPAVWNTCLLFFQTLLLAGYAYVLLITRQLSLRAQIFLHLALLLVAAMLLPPTFDDAQFGALDFDRNPAWWLLGVLLTTIGLPFLVISATAPLLQRWFAETFHTAARDPYFLYAASNVGSLLALLLFPLALEPAFATGQQFAFWSGGYLALILLIALCSFAAWRMRTNDGSEAASLHANTVDTDGELLARLSWTERLLWLALAFAPSSLVMGVTTYVTTDIAAVPLLWTLPLALYLLTFVLAFAKRQLLSLAWLARITMGAGVLVTLVLLSGATEPVWFLVPVHLIFFFCAALACHTRLAVLRPAPARLAEYYLWLSLGGALGGFFNALAAPLLFNTTLEYPLAIVLACLLLPAARKERETPEQTMDEMTADDGRRAFARSDFAWRDFAWRDFVRGDLAWAAGLGALTAAFSVVVMRVELGTLERIAISIGVPLFILNHRFTKRPARFACGLAAVMIGSSFLTLNAGRTLYAGRNFYGALRVTQDPDTNKLYHGSTLHGRGFADPARRCEPLSYYHRESPLGSVFEVFNATGKPDARIAVVGLGTGATVAYSRPNQTWTFYELNPAVIRLARDSRFFGYLNSCAAAPVEIVQGDARLRLRDAANGSYDLIVLDAFSSDAVPVHLLTREAMRLYFAKLAPGGWLAMHVSNRSLDLHAVVARLAQDANLQAFYANDPRLDSQQGREPSQWIVLARPDTDLATLTAADPRWQPLPANPRAPLWRDDFSSIISIFK